MRMRELMRFIFALAHQRRPRQEFDALIADALAAKAEVAQQQEIQTMKETMAEWLHAKGRAEGRADGELLATRENLRDLLEIRFGRLPDDALRRIESISDLAHLRACLRQVHRVDSLDELPL
jgi:hypothetical protein